MAPKETARENRKSHLQREELERSPREPANHLWEVARTGGDLEAVAARMQRLYLDGDIDRREIAALDRALEASILKPGALDGFSFPGARVRRDSLGPGIEATTKGREVVFDEALDRASTRGQYVEGHEAAHLAQVGRGALGIPSAPLAAVEAEAAMAGHAMARGESALVRLAASPTHAYHSGSDTDTPTPAKEPVKAKRKPSQKTSGGSSKDPTSGKKKRANQAKTATSTKPIKVDNLGQSFQEIAGKAIELLVPFKGDEGSLSLKVEIPVYSAGISTTYLTLSLKGEVGHDESEGTKADKYTASLEVALGVKDKVDVWFAKVWVGLRAVGLIEVSGHSGASAIELMSLTVYEQAHAVSPELADMVWGQGFKDTAVQDMTEEDSASAGIGIEGEFGVGAKDDGGDSQATLSGRRVWGKEYSKSGGRLHEKPKNYWSGSVKVPLPLGLELEIEVTRNDPESVKGKEPTAGGVIEFSVSLAIDATKLMAWGGSLLDKTGFSNLLADLAVRLPDSVFLSLLALDLGWAGQARKVSDWMDARKAALEKRGVDIEKSKVKVEFSGEYDENSKEAKISLEASLEESIDINKDGKVSIEGSTKRLRIKILDNKKFGSKDKDKDKDKDKTAKKAKKKKKVKRKRKSGAKKPPVPSSTGTGSSQ